MQSERSWNTESLMGCLYQILLYERGGKKRLQESEGWKIPRNQGFLDVAILAHISTGSEEL